MDCQSTTGWMIPLKALTHQTDIEQLAARKSCQKAALEQFMRSVDVRSAVMTNQHFLTPLSPIKSLRIKLITGEKLEVGEKWNRAKWAKSWMQQWQARGAFSFFYCFSFHSLAYLISQSEWLLSPMSCHRSYMLNWPKRSQQAPSAHPSQMADRWPGMSGLLGGKP